MSSSAKSSGGTRAIRPRLRGSGAPAPGEQAIFGLEQQARAFDECTRAGQIRLAEHVGPGLAAADGGARAARAVRKTAHRLHRDAGAARSRCRGDCQPCARRRFTSGSAQARQVMQTKIVALLQAGA